MKPYRTGKFRWKFPVYTERRERERKRSGQEARDLVHAAWFLICSACVGAMRIAVNTDFCVRIIAHAKLKSTIQL